MAQKRNHVAILIEDSDGEAEEQQPSKSSSDGGEDVSDDEVDDEESDEDEDDGEEEVKDDGEEEDEDDGEEDDEGDGEEEDEDDGEEEDEDDSEEEVGDDDDDEDLKQVEDKEEFSSKESIRKLLQPFGKDKLVEIIKEATLKNSALLSRALSTFDSDPVHRKIFVHGLASDATSEAVAAAFSPFGKIEDCRVIVNLKTGGCRGYGFVLFKSRAAAARALKDPLKKIGSRTANCHLASSGPQAGGGKASSDPSGRKVLVNNLIDKVDPEALRTFFSKYGEIEEGPLGCDPVSGKLRGFAIFIYKTEEGCEKALKEPKKYFDGCEIYCRRSLDGYTKNNNTQITPLPGTQAVSSGFQSNVLTPNFASAATLMGQNLGSSTTMLSGHYFGQGPTTLMGKNIGPGLSSFVGQNGGSGHFNPAAGLYPALSMGAGVAPAQPLGYIPAIRGSGLGLNNITPSMIDNYGTLSALHGLGAFQNSSSTTALKPQSGVGSLETPRLPPFFGQ